VRRQSPHIPPSESMGPRDAQVPQRDLTIVATTSPETIGGGPGSCSR
jgi:hypothetical protein